MIRLTALLCGGLFVVLLIAGQDKGQVRQGLMTPPAAPENTVTIADAKPAPLVDPEPQVTQAVFVPAQPVRVAPETPKPEVVKAAEPAREPEGKLAVVTSRSVNVRSGPSTSDTIIGRLSNAEQVLVVFEETPVEGWSLVRIEGDGIQGYVASRLLQDIAP